MQRGLRAVGGAMSLLMLASASQLRAATTFSRSGQFVVHSLRAGAPTLNRISGTDDAVGVLLHPDLVAVGCERIKAAFLDSLKLRDEWRGKVHLRLLPGGAPDQRPRVGATRFADGWQYSISTPDEIKTARFVEAVVTALLMELSNRIPGPQPAEVPLWLAEGMTAEVLSQVGPDLVPQHSPLLGKYGDAWGQIEPGTRVARLSGSRDAARAVMRQQGALTFRELSLPPEGVMDGEAAERYRASAQAMLLELRRLPNGDAMLLGMLRRLTQHLNWQTAFLQAYASAFGSLLEVEKWWAMASFQFVVGQTALSWTVDRSLAALAEAVTVTIEVRTSARDLPARQRVSLQEALSRLAPEQANTVFQQKSRQLTALQPSMAPEVAALCQQYRDALEGRYISLGAVRAVRVLINRLDDLDRELLFLRDSAKTAESENQE